MSWFTKICLVVVALACAITWTRQTSAQCDSDAVLQQQVAEFNKFAAICEKAALQEHDYIMRLWHWKACMWDTHAPKLTADQIQTAIKLGLRLYEAKL